jgi:hypothetical protein
MSSDLPSVNRLKALEMIAKSSESRGRLSVEDQSALEDALEQDLDAALHQPLDDHQRLVKIEGQVHALSDAVIAIAEASDAVDDAVKTVKDKM